MNHNIGNVWKLRVTSVSNNRHTPKPYAIYNYMYDMYVHTVYLTGRGVYQLQGGVDPASHTLQ